MPQLVGFDLTLTPATPVCAVGTEYVDPRNGNKYEYVKGSATIAQGEFVKISEDGLGTATSLTTTTNPSTEPAKVGCIGASTGLTSTTYGWAQRKGAIPLGKFAASCVQDVKIYTTGTNGVVDDSATTLINGLKLLTTIVGAATVPCYASVEMTTVVA